MPRERVILTKQQKTILTSLILYIVLTITLVVSGVDYNNQKDIKGESVEVGYVTKVIDGDTFEIKINDKTHTVRLIGIDAPESVHPSKPVQCYSLEAKYKLQELIENKEVALVKDKSEVDRYSRKLRYVYKDDLFVNKTLVESGYALAKAYVPDTRFEHEFESAEELARNTKQGLWNESTCNGNVGN